VSITASHMSRVSLRMVESRVMPALLTSTSIDLEILLDLGDPRLAGREIAGIELVDGDAGLGLELLRRFIVAGVGGGDLVSLSFSMREMAPPMPRVSARHDCNPFGHFFPTVVTPPILYPVLRGRGQERRICRPLPDNGALDAGHRTAIMKPFTALLGAAAGTHAADQLALATLPLTATLVLGAGPGVLGLLVAAQSAAWMLLSLPARRVDRPHAAAHFADRGVGAWLGGVRLRRGRAAAGIVSLLGVAAFVGASGTVVYVLTSISLLPALVPRPTCRAPMPVWSWRAPIGEAWAAPFVAACSPNCCRRPGGMPSPPWAPPWPWACVLALAESSRPDQRRAATLLSSLHPGRRPLRGAPRAACAASASARSSGTSPFSPCSPLGAVGVGPARPRPGTYGPRPVGLRRGPDPGRAGGAGLGAAACRRWPS